MIESLAIMAVSIAERAIHRFLDSRERRLRIEKLEGEVAALARESAERERVADAEALQLAAQQEVHRILGHIPSVRFESAGLLKKRPVLAKAEENFDAAVALRELTTAVEERRSSLVGGELLTGASNEEKPAASAEDDRGPNRDVSLQPKVESSSSDGPRVVGWDEPATDPGHRTEIESSVDRASGETGAGGAGEAGAASSPKESGNATRDRCANPVGDADLPSGPEIIGWDEHAAEPSAPPPDDDRLAALERRVRERRLSGDE